MIVGQKFNKVGWEDVGEVRNDDAVGLYLNEILKNVNVPNIKQRHFRVLVDCANGTTVVTTPKLLRRLGVNYMSVNSNSDGFFPGRGSEPTEETLKELISFAKSAPFDLSVAHDGDGDRSVFLDEKGEMIDGDKLVALVADHMLELKKGDLVFPVASSFLIDRVTIVGPNRHAKSIAKFRRDGFVQDPPDSIRTKEWHCTLLEGKYKYFTSSWASIHQSAAEKSGSNRFS